MTENPFSSPTLSADELDAHGSPRRNRRRKAMLGMLAGTSCGALVGAAMLVSLYQVYEVLSKMQDSLQPVTSLNPQTYLSTLEQWTLLPLPGGLLGGALGALVGLVLGDVAGGQPEEYRPTLHWISMATLSLGAGAAGGLTGYMYSLSVYIYWPGLIVVGMALGLLAGAAGGSLLARLLSRIAWGGRGRSKLLPTAAPDEA